MPDKHLTKKEKVEKLFPSARGRYDAHLVEIEVLVRDQRQEESDAAADRRAHTESLKFIGENLSEQLLAMDLILDPPPQMAMDFNENIDHETHMKARKDAGVDEGAISPDVIDAHRKAEVRKDQLAKNLANNPKVLDAMAGMVPDGGSVEIQPDGKDPVVLDQAFKNRAQERAAAIRKTQSKK